MPSEKLPLLNLTLKAVSKATLSPFEVGNRGVRQGNRSMSSIRRLVVHYDPFAVQELRCACLIQIISTKESEFSARLVSTACLIGATAWWSIEVRYAKLRNRYAGVCII